MILTSRVKRVMSREDEPKGWPLKRPLTHEEWNQIIKAMILRRVPETRSISHEDLARYANDDISAAFDAGRVFTDQPVRHIFIPTLIRSLIKDRLLREGVVEINHVVEETKIDASDLFGALGVTIKSSFQPLIISERLPNPYGEVKHVFRTDTTQDFFDLLPKHVEAVLNFLPVTNVMDWMASMLPPDSAQVEQGSEETG